MSTSSAMILPKGAILYNEAYGVSVKKEIESRLSRGVSMGALHTALVRLEDKGYIKSFNGEQTEDRILLCLY
jgi:PadR family transcriptional regulator PadR